MQITEGNGEKVQALLFHCINQGEGRLMHGILHSGAWILMNENRGF